MPRKVTVTLQDGTVHVYDNAPDDITPEQVTARAEQDFGMPVVSLDGGRQATQAAAKPVSAPRQPAKTPSVSMENVPEFEYEGAIQRNMGTGVESVLTKETRNIQEIDDALAAAWRSGERDPAKLAAIQNSVKEQFIGQYPELATYGSNINARTVAQAMRYEADQRARGNDLKGYVFAPSKVTTGLKDPERPTTMGGQFVESAQRSAANMYNSGVGAVALGADVVGADETADALLQEYINNNAKIAYEYGTPMQTGEVDSLGDAGMFAADTFGELVPQLASSLGLGYVGKQAAEYGIKKGMQDFVEDRVQNGIARDVAEKEALALIAKRGTIGAVAGTSSSSIVQEAGATFGETFEQTGEKAPISSLIAGVASGSLDAILPMTVLKKLGGVELVDRFKGEFIKRAAKEGAKGFAIEGGTEALQEFITSLPKSVVTGENPFTEENFNQMFEAFIRGGLGGSGINVATEGVNTLRSTSPRSFEQGDRIVVPTAKGNTKAYRTQLKDATATVNTRVNDITSKWTNAPAEVKVLENFKNERDIDDDALGVYTADGRVLLNTEQIIKYAERRKISPEQMTEAVLFHEALGHHGLTQTFGQDLDGMLDALYNEGNSQFRDKVDQWIARHPKAYPSPNNAAAIDPVWQRIRATEEVLAEMSEAGQLNRTIVDRIVDKIKEYARRVGMDGLARRITGNDDTFRYSLREIRGILSVSQRNVTEGGSTNAIPGSLKNKIVYHGSPHDFEPTPDNPLGAFDHSKMGTGEGRQVRGWGTYLTDSREIADKTYRERLSPKKITWKGVDTNNYQLRELAKRSVDQDKAAEIATFYGMDPDYMDRLIDDAITLAKEDSAFDIKTFAEDAYNDDASFWKATEFDRRRGRIVDGWSEKGQDEFVDKVTPLLQPIKDGFEIKAGGKLYEVEIPDDAKWVEFEDVPLAEQPELREALREQGILILPDEDFRERNVQYATVSAQYEKLVRTSQDETLSDSVRDDAWKEANRLGPLRTELSRRLKDVISEETDGEDAYRVLSEKLGSDRETSMYLAGKGFTGNRFLADNVSGTRSRGNTPDPKRIEWLEKRISALEEYKKKYEEGDTSIGIDEVNRNLPSFKKMLEEEKNKSDTFNYVIFDDNTPKIVNKYMKPSDGDMDYASSDRTYSSGSQRPRNNTRSAIEARKQFWRNKYDPNWDPSDPNGLPAKVRSADRYMRGDGPIDPNDLDADDMIYSQDAIGLLDRILDGYETTAVDIAAIEQTFLDRGVTPSSVTRLARTNPGDLVKRRMRYDIAAMKLNDRVLDIEEDIRTNGLTEEKQLAYLKADTALRDISAAIFDLDSELGRALNNLKKMSMTRRKASTIREFLKEADLGEAMADPETFMAYMAKRQEAIKADKAKAKDNNIAYDVLGVPRAMMSSLDMSAPMRQGISLIGTSQYWKSFFKMFTFIGPSGKDNYNWLMRSIAKHPNYELMQKARLSFSELDGKFSGREEDFQSDLAKKIPGVKMSEQAYAGFLNKLRADTFNKMVELVREPDGSVSDQALIDLGKFINSATGRAELPRELGAFSVRGKKVSTGINLQAASTGLNAAFFSPRLIVSRINMLNPRFYAKLDPRIRKQALLESVKSGGLVLAATFLLASMTPDAEVEWADPRSSDFLKIKVGDTRFDMMGGFSQYLTFGARSYLWMQNAVFGSTFGYVPEVKSTTGNERDLDGRGRYGETYADTFLKFFRGKLSPNASYVADAFAGENVVGKEFTWLGSAVDRVIPMSVNALIENTKEYGVEKGVRYSVPNVFGIGTTTFPPKSRDPKQTFEAPPTFKGMELDRAAKDWWEETRNTNFKARVEIYAARTGFEWKDIPHVVQEEIIADAKEDSNEYTRRLAEEELMTEE